MPLCAICHSSKFNTKICLKCCLDPSVVVGRHKLKEKTGILIRDYPPSHKHACGRYKQKRYNLDNYYYDSLNKLNIDGYIKRCIKYSDFYLLKDAFDYGKRIYQEKPKNLKKVEEMEKKWKTEIDNTKDRQNKIKELITNLTDKFTYDIEFNNPKEKNIIDKEIRNNDMSDNDLAHLLIIYFSKIDRFKNRKFNLQKKIKNEIPENYWNLAMQHPKYIEYLDEDSAHDFNKDEMYQYHEIELNLNDAFTNIFTDCEARRVRDEREMAIKKPLLELTNENKSLLISILRAQEVNADYNSYVEDNIGEFNKVYAKIEEFAKPIVEMYTQGMKLKTQLAKYNINLI